MKKYSFNIIGAGAMGHLWTSFLCKHGFKTSLFSRAKRPARLFDVDSPLGNFTQRIEYQTLANWCDADVVLICVKAHQLSALCQALSDMMIIPRHLILIMNGMGLVEIVHKHLPKIESIHASTVHGVHIEKNTIIHTGKGKTILGNIGSNYPEAHFLTLVKQLNIVLPEVNWNKNHHQAMNLKLVINSIINPLTAIANQRNGCILIDGKLNPDAELLLVELKPLLGKFIPDLSFEQIKQEIELVAYNTRGNVSSMLQDIRCGKITEIDFINGYLVSLAQKYQIKLSNHSKIIHQIKGLCL